MSRWGLAGRLMGLLSIGAVASGARAVQEPRAIDAESAAERELIARWREALELDLPGEVLADGPALVTGTGRLRGDGEAVALVARALFFSGQESLARDVLRNARPDPARTRSVAHVAVARAELALAGDELARVIRSLALEGPGVRHPELPACWLVVGRAYARMGRSERADVFLRRFLELAPLDPEAPSAWYILAQHAVQRRDTDGAGELRARAESSARWQAYYVARRIQIRERPDASLPRLGLAQLWLEVDELERARAALTELVAMAPDFSRGWSHLGEALRRLGDAAGATEAFGRALALEPGDRLARFGRGMVQKAAGALEAAARDFRWFVTNAPSEEARTVAAHLLLARILAEQGDEHGARAMFARYRELGGTEPLD
ncbi:MAG: tetratricopeptide repeat protein [Planctomycetota bacterium]|nr:MAG: tetratricopeptide repeat protein [Planctomycetota bacterium]